MNTPTFRSRAIRLANGQPKGSKLRKALLEVLSAREQFVLKMYVPTGPEGDEIKEDALRIIGEAHFETELRVNSRKRQLIFVIPEERQAVNAWRKAERALGIRIDMGIEDPDDF